MEPDLSQMITTITLEGMLEESWKYDTNTTLLLALKDGLAGILTAIINTTNRFEDTHLINAVGMAQALNELLTGLMDNIQLMGKDGVNHGSWQS